MANGTEVRRGFTVLDGAALVMGAAVASVHLKLAIPEPVGPRDWTWGAVLFTWLAMSSAGPFLYLARRFGVRGSGAARVGDRLWAVSGVPWLVAALVGSGDPSPELASGRLDPSYVACLTAGLAIATMATVPALAWEFLLGDPSKPRPIGPTPWTNRMGWALAVAWPIQWGVGLIVMS